MFEDSDIQAAIAEGVKGVIEELPKIRIDAVCHECRYREFAIVQGYSVDFVKQETDIFFKTRHPQHRVDVICSKVGRKVPLVLVFQRVPYVVGEVLPITQESENPNVDLDLHTAAEKMFPRKNVGGPETISVQELRNVATKQNQDPDLYVKTVTGQLASQYAENQWIVQKWCPKCKMREEAIMYAADRSLLEEFLDKQSKEHAHKHKVERKIEKAKPGSLISDFHRIDY